MNKYYRLSIFVLLGLFLLGTPTIAMAEPQNTAQNKAQYNKAYKNRAAFQDKNKQTKKDSLVKPKTRRDTIRRYNYRQNTARDALKSGRIVSLGVIRKRVKQSFPGKIVDVRLLEPKRNNKPYIYKVKVLRKDGKLLELRVDAATARIVGVKGNK